MSKYDLIASIRRSKIKLGILRLLGEPKTATDLKKIIGAHRESISRALLQMKTQGLVVCITPEQPNFRFYKITEKAKALMKTLEKVSK